MKNTMDTFATFIAFMTFVLGMWSGYMIGTITEVDLSDTFTVKEVVVYEDLNYLLTLCDESDVCYEVKWEGEYIPPKSTMRLEEF